VLHCSNLLVSSGAQARIGRRVGAS
jgi:hypothetical protein